MDLISLPIDYDKEKIDGRFRLVNIIAQRAKELAQSGQPKISTKSKKITTIALQEAVTYNLEFITGQEAKQAKEEAKKLDYKKFLEEKKRESEQEDLTELEKDLKFYLDEKTEPAITSIEKLFSDSSESKKKDSEDSSSSAEKTTIDTEQSEIIAKNIAKMQFIDDSMDEESNTIKDDSEGPIIDDDSQQYSASDAEDMDTDIENHIFVDNDPPIEDTGTDEDNFD